MADFPYSPHAANVNKFLRHVQTAGVPQRLTLKGLKEVGFKSSNDRRIISILKFLGFLDSTGAPTKTWIAYRDRENAGAILAGAMRQGYADLFSTYPDANRKDKEALRNYFSAHTKVGDRTLGLIVTTFQALAAMADFGATPTESLSRGNQDGGAGGAGAGMKKAPAEGGTSVSRQAGPTININVQLQIPATEDASIYDKLFAALRKHLFS